MMTGSHQWVLIGHVHLDQDHITTLLDDDEELEIEGAELCDVDVTCAICERAFSSQEYHLVCEGPPAAYTRKGEPIHARDN